MMPQGHKCEWKVFGLLENLKTSALSNAVAEISRPGAAHGHASTSPSRLPIPNLCSHITHVDLCPYVYYTVLESMCLLLWLPQNHKLLDIRGPKWVASFGDLTCLCDCGELASAQQMSGE